MKHDWLGNPVTTVSDATLAGINDFITGLLAYETRAGHIIEAAQAEPENCLANAYAALFHLFLESRDAPDLALPWLLKAEAAAPHASAREQLTTAIVRAWVDGDIAQVLRLSHQVACDYPRDLAIVKQAQYHYFNLGNCAGMLTIAEQVRDTNADIPYMHGLAAFALEQCHLLKDAESSARQAIAMQRKEPWAHHALAHVLLTRGRIEEGLDFLQDVSTTWTDLNSFMYTHNWWHLALFLINRGRYDEVLGIYDKHIWGIWKEYSQDQIGAVSLLMRLELAGYAVGNRWDDLGTHLVARVNDFVQPFLTMQYLYGAGLPQADQLMDNLRAFAPRAPAFTREVWGGVCLSACKGLLAHARGQWESAFHNMAEAAPGLLSVGGSHAQRGLFDQVLLDSMVKTGRHAAAQQMLEAQRGYDARSVPVNLALADVYTHLDLPRQAAQARARVIRP